MDLRGLEGDRLPGRGSNKGVKILFQEVPTSGTTKRAQMNFQDERHGPGSGSSRGTSKTSLPVATIAYRFHVVIKYGLQCWLIISVQCTRQIQGTGVCFWSATISSSVLVFFHAVRKPSGWTIQLFSR